MAHTFHHVHLKAQDPHRSAQWYVDMLEAKPLGERDLGGAINVPVELGGITINISGPRPGETLGPENANLHYGLEHIAVGTDDLARDLARMKRQGTKVFEERTTPAGVKIAFIAGPDSVRIELMQV
ncbi:MAG: VOC family protein [Chloroflexi bacterium]|nr:VOC family protein [Chloroflexota bacterium]